jgi:hypothetical protein
MAEPVGPGNWIERVKPSRLLAVGSIWQVEAIGEHPVAPHCDDCIPGPTPWVRLVGEPSDTDPRPYCLCGFRLVYRPRAELIKALQAPPQRALEAA